MDEGTADFEANHTEDDVEFFPSFAGDKKSAFRAEMGETQVVYVGAEKYTGEYVVAPDFVGKTLETAHKLMDENITVKPILVSKVSNHAGGNTIYIGGDIAYGKPVQQ